MQPVLTNLHPPQDSDHLDNALIRVEFTLPAATNPASVKLLFSDQYSTHYVVNIADPDLSTPVLMQRAHHKPLSGPHTVPSGFTYGIDLQPERVIGFHTLEILAWDAATGDSRQFKIRIRLRHP